MINRHLTVQLVTTAVGFIAHAGTFMLASLLVVEFRRERKVVTGKGG
jgi:hypothetical protein